MTELTKVLKLFTAVLHVTVATIVWTVNVDSLVIESIFHWLVLKSSLHFLVLNILFCLLYLRPPVHPLSAICRVIRYAAELCLYYICNMLRS